MGHVNWSDKNVFVTGSSGFLGSWMVKYLVSKKAKVVCLLRDWVCESELIRSSLLNRVNYVRGDITDYELIARTLNEYNIEVVFHLAAQAIVVVANRNPISTFESDIKGTWTLLEACRHNRQVKAICVGSSDKAYREDCLLPYKEDMPLGGSYPYDVSKSCADLIAQSYAKTYQLPIAITRCGNLYGGGDFNWDRIIPGTIRAVIRKQAPIVRSNGQSIRDYFYVEDGVSAYITLAEKLLTDNLCGQSFNFSGDNSLKVIDVVEYILRLMQCNYKPIILNQSSNEIIEQRLDIQKAKTILAWEPAYTFEDGLCKTIDWYKGFFNERY